MRLARIICGISLLLLSCVVLHNVIQAREYREIMHDLSGLRPNVRPYPDFESTTPRHYPGDGAPPRYELGTMFIPPRVVAHSNSWLLLLVIGERHGPGIDQCQRDHR